MTNRVGDNTLEHLEAWVHECLSSDASPKEIYDSIVKTVKDEAKYHKESQKRAENLLLMLKGNLSALYDREEDPIAGKVDMGGPIVEDSWHPAKEGESFDETLKRVGYEYTPTPPYTLDSYSAQETPNIPHRY